MERSSHSSSWEITKKRIPAERDVEEMLYHLPCVTLLDIMLVTVYHTLFAFASNHVIKYCTITGLVFGTVGTWIAHVPFATCNGHLCLGRHVTDHARRGHVLHASPHIIIYGSDSLTHKLGHVGNHARALNSAALLGLHMGSHLMV